MTRPTSKSTLIPYTTLFRSKITQKIGAKIRKTVRKDNVSAQNQMTRKGVTVVNTPVAMVDEDRKSTRLNSSHVEISYAVFCLKKKKTIVFHKSGAEESSVTE